MRILFRGLPILLLMTVLCSCGRKDAAAVWKAGIEIATDTIACQEVFHDWGSDNCLSRKTLT